MSAVDLVFGGGLLTIAVASLVVVWMRRKG